MRLIHKILGLCLLPLSTSVALAPHAMAQGQDSTPFERDAMVIAELLPGDYNNANQAYFDTRRKLHEDLQHQRLHVTVERVELDAFGEYVFWAQVWRGQETEPFARRLYSLAADNDAGGVRMKMYFFDGEDNSDWTDAPNKRRKLRGLRPGNANYQEGCDVLWRREPGQFKGETDSATCRVTLEDIGEADVIIEKIISPDSLWVGQWIIDESGNTTRGRPEGVPYQLTRTRTFNCYADIPGVAGGRDEPFDRYQIENVHDMGGMKWFTAKDGREFGVTLRNVEWAVNNEVGAFTRNSFVMYLLEKTDDGVKTLTYGWTEPSAERIGINMQWMLVNCFMTSNRDVTPFFGKEPL